MRPVSQMAPLTIRYVGTGWSRKTGGETPPIPIDRRARENPPSVERVAEGSVNHGAPKPRPTLATHGAWGDRVRVLIDEKGGRVRVHWYEQGLRRVKSWADTRDGRRAAKAWAAEFAQSRATGTPYVKRITLRALWTKYQDAAFDAHRPNTRRNYSQHWRKWELFLGREFIAEDVRPEHVDRFRKELRAAGLAVGHVQRVVTTIKTIYRWGQGRQLLNRNDLSTYRWKIAKDERPEPPDEYTGDERDAIIAALAKRRDRSDGWRPWAAVMIAAHSGAREHQILHLQWQDIDLLTGTIVWRARWDKVGHDRAQPVTDGTLSALLTAKWWRERDGYDGPWIFYSAHGRKARLGSDERATYRKDSLWLALTKAERRGGVVHQEWRAMHGFRRNITGDLVDKTGDVRLALDFIGDSDIRQARRYLKVRDDRLARAAAIIDQMAVPATTTTVTEPSLNGPAPAKLIRK